MGLELHESALNWYVVLGSIPHRDVFKALSGKYLDVLRFLPSLVVWVNAPILC